MDAKSATPLNARIWPGWLVSFTAAFALYAATANRGAQWQDSGYFILRAVTGELINPLGLALTHPLHYWLSRLAIRIDFLEPAFAITLISSMAGAVAVANLFGCVTALTGNRWAATLAAASLGLANTFWQLSTVTETYTISAAFLTMQCWCLILFVKSAIENISPSPKGAEPIRTSLGGRNLAFLLMFFLNGLMETNHNLALLTTPMLMLAAFWGLSRRAISISLFGAAILLWLVGASPYIALVANEAIRSGDWAGAIRSALFGRSFGDEVLSVTFSWRLMLMSVGFVLLNFPNLLLPAALYGLKRAWSHEHEKCVYRLLMVGFAVHALFAFRYPVSDQHFFFLSTYVFLSLFAGLGFARWITPRAPVVHAAQCTPGPQRKGVVLAAALLILATPAMYAAVPTIGRQVNALEFFKRNKPYRDDYAYLFLPWSVSERSADRLSREAVELAGDSGVIIVEDLMAEYAVRYGVHRSERSGIAVASELPPRQFEEAAAAGRRIVLVPQDRDRPITHSLTGTWRRQGDLYVLEPG